jgi:hypothetical protein
MKYKFKLKFKSDAKLCLDFGFWTQVFFTFNQLMRVSNDKYLTKNMIQLVIQMIENLTNDKMIKN